MNRRQFIECATWAGAGSIVGGCIAIRGPSNATGKACSVTEAQLEEEEARPILHLESLDSPITIDSVQLLKRDREYFVHVRSKDGAQGISVTNERASILYPILNQQVIPYFIGKDARDLEDHLVGVYRYESNYKLQGLAFWCPVAWVEFAILDMLGRVTGRSMGELLGGVVRRRVPYYVASGRRDTTAEEEVQYLQELVAETGARAVTFRVGGRMSSNADALPGRTEQLIPLARKILGGDIAIHADANGSYDPPKAAEVGRMLEDVHAVHFEEPCPFDHLEDTQRVADALTIPVAGGEQESSQRRFRWMILHRGVDVLQPDLHYYGGLIRSTRVARMAALAGMPTTTHISGGFGFVYMLHFASHVPDIGLYQEYKRGIARYRDWFNPPLEAKGGALTVPTGPGVGIVRIDDLLKDAQPVV